MPNLLILHLAAGTALSAVATSLPAAGPTPGYRDLNRNGRMDVYENRALPVAQRVDDLVRQMTLEEKVGAMMHGSLPAVDNPQGFSSKGYDLPKVEAAIIARGVNSFISRLTVPPAVFAEQNNAVQRIAERGRLGIPVTISTDPRNHFQAVLGASTTGGGFSLWPETLGLAAIGDPELVRRFGDIARREYRAVGIHMALSPQADLATEPRWPRVTATFGADPATVSAMAGAYVAGFQGGQTGLASGGVATVVKHWVGYGAQPEGFDAHSYYGRIARLDDASFARHVAAFDGAFNAKAAGVMPTYPILQGVTLAGKSLEPVGAGFSRQLLTDLLRNQKKFDGLILSDWAITNDCPRECMAPTEQAPQSPRAIGMPWGVETLSQEARFAKAVNAGVDQFGGVDDPAPLLKALRGGKIDPALIDSAVRRVMALKFVLGLFDDPFVDAGAAAATVNDNSSHAAGEAAQRAAQVLLENRGALPVHAGRRVWLVGVDATAARKAGLTVVDDPRQADVALVRVATPSEKLHPHAFFGSRQNEGRLDFRAGDPGFDAIQRAAAVVPTIVAVDMDRPAVLTNVRDRAAALLVLFGASDAALLDVITGKARARGRLPFELPASMAAVAAQDPARPDDSAGPLYRRGAGIVD